MTKTQDTMEKTLDTTEKIQDATMKKINNGTMTRSKIVLLKGLKIIL